MGFVPWDNLFEQSASADSSTVTYQLTKCLAQRLKGPVPTAEPRLRKLLVPDGRQHMRLTSFFLCPFFQQVGGWSQLYLLIAHR